MMFRAKGDVWLARRMDIEHHWRALVGLPEWTDSSESGKWKIACR
jgi:hypothetical protein